MDRIIWPFPEERAKTSSPPANGAFSATEVSGYTSGASSAAGGYCWGNSIRELSQKNRSH